MSNESFPIDPSSTKLSKASRKDRWRGSPDEHPQKPRSLAEKDPAPLTDLIEQVITGQISGNYAVSAQGAALRPGDPANCVAGVLPGKLLQELSAAQEQLSTGRPETPLLEKICPPELQPALTDPADSHIGAFRGADASPVAQAAAGGARLQKLWGFLAKGAAASILSVRKLSRWLQPRNWRRRYLALLSFVHRHVFDRGIERLLFIKTPAPHLAAHTNKGGSGPCLSQAPIPAKVLEWALSALPSDLKRYAFVDFMAGNGRSLLLAARRNFEHATGYVFDAGSCEVLELNLAQYSRSYMSCRDVRALRGDRDGLAIPSQPAVLYFPDGLTESQLTVILGHACASQKLGPRPVYLIFEKSGRERGLDQMQDFKRVPLPFMNRLKASFFSPAKIAVYKALNEGSAG